MTRAFTFIGVTTGQSSIMKVFPRWREILGLGTDVEVVGCDLPIHAPPERYRAVVSALKADPANLGALVTTHKLDLYQAARDLFDGFDEYARLLNAVSCLAKRDGRLLGWSKDPISEGMALDGLLGPGYFARTGGHVLCLGSGGAALALALHLFTRPEAEDRPRRMVVTDRSEDRLQGMRDLHRALDAGVPIDYVHAANAGVGDALASRLPPHSLVINATGMGKDTPGSPLTDAARFPEGGIVWDLNYRGRLDFLRQALAQREAHGLRVEDGWRCFILGWTTVMEEVFDRRISAAELEMLERAAADARPSLQESR